MLKIKIKLLKTCRFRELCVNLHRWNAKLAVLPEPASKKSPVLRGFSFYGGLIFLIITLQNTHSQRFLRDGFFPHEKKTPIRSPSVLVTVAGRIYGFGFNKVLL